jgi:ferredoxin--NADP+ reductase
VTFVITQPCCNDASCVSVCPVDCIHPTPDEPAFLTAEMLYIDPDQCIDCGACVDECPVDAIFPEDSLAEDSERYLQINADYYVSNTIQATSPTPRTRVTLPSEKRLDVAIVGAGPAALYAAEELVKYRQVTVDVFDRLPTPHGLVRAGVAPDHPSTKGVEKSFVATAKKPNFNYFLNVDVGEHITPGELKEHYGAVIYAHGASTDKKLGISGEDLSGSVAATDFVAWYNGHPDYANAEFDLSGSRAVIVGNGNVALDVARILSTPTTQLAKTDIADHALDALRRSNIREVVILGRRGVAQAAYTNGEFMAMGSLPGVDIVIDPSELSLDDHTRAAVASGTLASTVLTKIRLAEEYSMRPVVPGNKRIVFRYMASPVSIVGDGCVSGVRFVKNEFSDTRPGDVRPTDNQFDLATGFVTRAIGYRGQHLPGVPFDEALGIIPNTAGRITSTSTDDSARGLYVAGWIKRGATGGIGINRMCGRETAEAVIGDFVAGELPDPPKSRELIPELIAARGAQRIDADGWKKIDTAERAAGRQHGRRRIKLVHTDHLQAVALS